MVNVLYIGDYEEAGRLHTLPLHCKIDELEKPDKDLNVYTYEINVINVVFWDYIKSFNYQFCLEGKSDIDDLTQEESWKSLGYVKPL